MAAGVPVAYGWYRAEFHEEPEVVRTVGVDIGGTKIAVGLVDAEGDVSSVQRAPTMATSGAEELFGDVVAVIQKAVDASGTGGVEAIGVGCPGPMHDGDVSPVNIPAWDHFPLQARLEEHFELPVVLDNDAKAFAVAEGWTGAAAGVDNFMAVVVSTGVGGGIVLDGSLLHGRERNAGHLGHMVVVPGGQPCSCGARGCLEAEASGLALARKAVDRCDLGYVGDGPLLERWNEATGETELFGGTLSNVHGLTARSVVEAAREGGRWAIEIVDEAAFALGRAFSAVATLLDLDIIVLSGGVANAGDMLFDRIRDEIRKDACLHHARSLKVVPAKLGDTSAIVGAACLVHHAQGVRA